MPESQLSLTYPLSYLLSDLANHPELQEKFVKDPVAFAAPYGVSDEAILVAITKGDSGTVDAAVLKEITKPHGTCGFVRCGMLTELVETINRLQ